MTWWITLKAPLKCNRLVKWHLQLHLYFWYLTHCPLQWISCLRVICYHISYCRCTRSTPMWSHGLTSYQTHSAHTFQLFPGLPHIPYVPLPPSLTPPIPHCTAKWAVVVTYGASLGDSWNPCFFYRCCWCCPIEIYSEWTRTKAPPSSGWWWGTLTWE